MKFLEKFRDKLVHFLFPLVERFFLVLFALFLLLVLFAWPNPDTPWQSKSVLIWLWFVIAEIHWAGTMERDYLPIRPGSSLFYRIYRLIDGIFFLFVLLWLAAILIPGPLWLTYGFCGVFVAAVILRAVGDRKYRPKKPEE